MCGARFCVGVCIGDKVVVIKIGAYVHWVFILCWCLFY